MAIVKGLLTIFLQESGGDEREDVDGAGDQVHNGRKESARQVGQTAQREVLK